MNIVRLTFLPRSRHFSSVIIKTKAESWQAICSSFSPKYDLKFVYFPLRLVAGSSSPNFLNSSSSRNSVLVFVDYLRSHFSVSQSKAFHSRARGYLSTLRRVPWPEGSHSSFCCHFSLAKFLAAATNLFLSTAHDPGKAAYLILKHLLRSDTNFFLHIFYLFWTLHFFPSIWKTSSIIPIYKIGKPLESPASFRPISLTSFVSKRFERIILSRLLFFPESNFILFLRQAGFHPGRSTLDQIVFLLSPFWMS